MLPFEWLTVMARLPPLRTMLWFDSLAGLIAGVAMLALAGVLAAPMGVARELLLTTAAVNVGYGLCSLTLARRAAPPRRYVRALIVANLAWAVVCAVLVVRIAGPGRWLGATFYLLEGLFVGVLGLVEARVARRAFAPR
ncbi:MAG: hypothetical protein R2939_03015 [Kofleriaceae bacterium]